MARLARAKISADLLQEIMTKGWKVGLHGQTESLTCINGLPEGAIFRGGRYDFTGGPTFELLFEHESFDDIPAGCPIPVMQVEFRREYTVVCSDSNLHPEEALANDPS